MRLGRWVLMETRLHQQGFGHLHVCCARKARSHSVAVRQSTAYCIFHAQCSIFSLQWQIARQRECMSRRMAPDVSLTSTCRTV